MKPYKLSKIICVLLLTAFAGCSNSDLWDDVPSAIA